MAEAIVKNETFMRVANAFADQVAMCLCMALDRANQVGMPRMVACSMLATHLSRDMAHMMAGTIYAIIELQSSEEEREKALKMGLEQVPKMLFAKITQGLPGLVNDLLDDSKKAKDAKPSEPPPGT